MKHQRYISRENFLMAGTAILVGIPLGWGMMNAIAQISKYRKIRDLNFIDVLKSWIS